MERSPASNLGQDDGEAMRDILTGALLGTDPSDLAGGIAKGKERLTTANALFDLLSDILGGQKPPSPEPESPVEKTRQKYR